MKQTLPPSGPATSSHPQAMSWQLSTPIRMIMKNRLALLSCGAAVLAVCAFWNGEATAQSDSSGGGRTNMEFPINRKCTVTLDARSNSRSTMPKEMQELSGFVRQDTVQGVLIQANSDWLILKDDVVEFWIPRDKVLLMRATP